ncbi:HNH endonuclease [Planktothrix sp. FACHB-1355]|uniref:HNH endonuclease n=1 Tax=Aerosakkonema funiforme FACHB-1375 TaxID=2949571 RepID=A0A926VGR1_9CYAN|nr:HNH endonuclease [Aerosakkonema funiforme FACHB-1375]MBD3561695.1 HNH endonuclease [Planktothrix sp. FACHB-1355]
MKCKRCGKETTNPAFCSRSCAAAFNNRKYPKRSKQQKHCKHCGISIISGRSTCDACNPFYVDWSIITLRDVKGKALYQHSARVRQVARSVYRQSDKAKKCIVCGYERYYEVCHRKPIKDFPDDTPISVINDIDNLVALCPNHHWEFDNGLLTL